jgi:hypothetical protein
MVDIFEFWSKIGRGEKIHPADRGAFARMDAKRHGFRLDCLPAAFGGRLRDAPIVLLYLSPGFSQADLAAAKTNEGKDFYVRRWQGYEPAATSWTRSRTKNFGDWEIVRQKVAVLNIGAYHSTNVRSYHHCSRYLQAASRWNGHKVFCSRKRRREGELSSA